MRANAAYFARQSDEDYNVKFQRGRRWTLPPPRPPRKSARPGASLAGADFFDNDTTTPDYSQSLARSQKNPPVIIWLGKRHRLRPAVALVVARAAGLNEGEP